MYVCVYIALNDNRQRAHNYKKNDVSPFICTTAIVHTEHEVSAQQTTIKKEHFKMHVTPIFVYFSAR